MFSFPGSGSGGVVDDIGSIARDFFTGAARIASAGTLARLESEFRPEQDSLFSDNDLTNVALTDADLGELSASQNTVPVAAGISTSTLILLAAGYYFFVK